MNFLIPNYNQDILDKKFTNNSHCVSIWPPGMGMLVIIDPTVENYQILASGVLPGAKVVILNSEEDEVRQISRAILDYPVNSLHIICHGSPGSLQLGNIKLSFSNLGEYGAEFKRWGEVIGTGGIFLYGCEVAAGDIGKAFVGRLHELTGVGVAAAVGRVGCAELGGSWELGVKVGNVGDGLAFGEEVLVSYGGVFADITVNRQDDVIDPEDELTSLREAIIEATNNGDIEDTITLSPGTYTLTIQGANEDQAETGDLDIFAGGGGEIGFESASINIIGDSADTTIIDAQGLGDRVFDIIGLGVSVNISNVTIQNGSPVDGDGGGIRNRGGDVVLNNTVISNNSSTRIGEGGGQGGGISNNSGNLTINNSNISGNLAPSSNFSLGVGGGISNDANLTINNSTISGNTSGFSGGGIDNNGTATVTSSTIFNNNANDGGGFHNSGTAAISNSTISANLGENFGGGIWNDNTLEVNNSTITQNIADHAQNEVGNGGGIANGGTANINNTIIAGNFDNSSTTVEPDVSGNDTLVGAFNSNGSNLIGDIIGSSGFNPDEILPDTIDINSVVIEPNLANNNGSPTQTHALIQDANNPAIDGGNNDNADAANLTTDQSGSQRIVDGDGNGTEVVDIGAFEASQITLPIVSITATDAVATEGGNDPGQFAVNIDSPQNNDITVNYEINGTATNGIDYQALTGTVVIPGGQTSAVIDVVATTDETIELAETVDISLQPSLNNNYTLGEINTASVTINETPPVTLPIVSITATDAVATEGGNDPGQFAVNIDSPQNNDITVNYEINGTATNGIDYQALTGTVVIPGGQTSAVIDVVATTDETIELAETVDISLQPSLNNNYTLGEINTASVTINETLPVTLPIVSITATDAVATEGGNDPGQFAVNIDSPQNSDITVNYEINGTATNGIDYQALTGTVVIPGGQTSAVIDVVATTDETIELAETVDISLQPSLNNNYTLGEINTASVTINETLPVTLPIVSITATDAVATEGGNDPGQFAVNIDSPQNSDITVNYEINGTATNGIDYQALTGTVVIPGGQTSAVIDVVATTDETIELAETVDISLQPSLNNNYTLGEINTASVTINETLPVTLPIVSITATDAVATEGGNDPGQFAVNIDSPQNSDITVNYEINGTATNGIDYQALTGTVVIPGGQTSAVIDVVATTDETIELAETVDISLQPSLNNNYTLGEINTASVTINETLPVTLPIVSITATDAVATEGGNDPGQFAVNIDSPQNSDITVNYEINGTATNGIDYQALTGTVVIPGGQTSAVIDVVATTDETIELAETVDISLQPSLNNNYTLGEINTASVTINETLPVTLPIVSITATDAVATEGGNDPGQFAVNIDSPQNSDITVNYEINGTATNGIDYQALTGTVVIPGGQTSAVIDVVATTDETIELAETVDISLQPSLNNNYTLGEINTASVTINEVPIEEGSISGTKFNDFNNDGIFDSDELRIPGVTIYLDLDGDGELDLDEPSQITDNNGNYSFNNLAPGEYTVREVVPSGFTPTLTPPPVTITSIGEDFTNINFGNTANFPGISITQTDGSTNVTEGLTPDTYQIVLDSIPNDLVNIAIAPDNQIDLGAGPGIPITRSFDSTNALTPQIINVTAVDDAFAEGPHPGNITHSSTSNDPNYNTPTVAFTVDGTPSNLVTANIIDNDTPAVSSSVTTIQAAEGGFTGDYSLVLTTQPTAPVTINFETGDEIQPIAPITFDQTNWNSERLITVTAIDDFDIEGDHPGIINHVATSADGDYNLINILPVTVDITDNDTAGVSINPTDIEATEGGATSSYEVVLTTQPVAPVTINFDTGNQILPITPITFDQTNWNVGRPINVTAIDDSIVEGNHIGTISHRATSDDINYNGLEISQVTTNITDNDTAAVSIQPLITDATEGGATGSYEVVLTTQPTAPVTINFDTGDQIQPINSITFNETNWNIPQQIPVAALDDLIAENNHIGTISHQVISADENYNAIQASQVTVDITDNDTAGVSISPQQTTATEDGVLGNYQIVLTTPPTADVTINLNTDDQVQTVPTSINFTPENWNIPQPITVSAIDDDIVEGEQHLGRITHQAISDDLNYNNLLEISQVTVDITDNDAPQAIPGSISGTVFDDLNNDGIPDPGESGIPGVTIYLDLDNDEVFDPNEPSQITDNNGNYSFNNLSPNTYFVREVVPPGFIPTLTPGQVIIPPQGEDLTNINFGNTAANVPGISITQTGESTDVTEGLTTDTYQIELDSDPTDQVNITITSEGQALLSDNNNQIPSNTINLTFNPGNLGPQTITVTAADDNIAAGDSIGNIIHTATSNDQNYNGPTAPFTVDGTPSNVIAANIRDDDVPNVVITPTTTDATEGGATGSYQVFLTTEPIGDVAINFNTDQQIQPIEPITFDQTNWNVPRTVTVEAVEDNIPETETQNIGTITHQVSSQSDLSYNNLNISQVTVNIDDPEIPEPTQVIITETDGNTTFTPGGSDNYTIQLNSNPTTPIEIAIAPPPEINLGSGPGVPITREFNESNGTTPQNVTVTGVNDGNFSISHSATLDGIDPNLQFIVDGVPTNIVNANVTSQPPPPLGNISGTVFDDLNNDGIPDTTEGIGNITVFIDSNNNNILDPNETNIVTNPNGNYNFSELEANTYNIRAVPQGNFIPELIAPVPLLAGQNATDINIQIQNSFSPGSISGTVFDDLNNNDIFDPGETGLNNVTVSLVQNGIPIQQIVTDPNGNYNFSNLTPNIQYTLTAVRSPDLAFQQFPFPVTIPSGESVSNINFAYDLPNPGTLQFSNPTFSVTENDTVATVTINRTDGSDGVVSANINLSSDTAIQGVDFGNPFPNPIFFADGETQETVSIPIFDDSIIDGNKTVNLSLTNNVTGDATIGQPATATLNILDNEVPLPPIANPDTANITQGDPPITINVLANDQGESLGIIGFDNFSQAGNNVTIDGINNQIIYSLAPGFTTTEPFTDTFNYTISDNNPNTLDSTSTVSVVVNPQPEFPGSISGNIFNDINLNGLFDSGETGLGDITVFLDINQNDTLDPNEQQATRNGFGFYNFPNLLPGNYTVRTISPQPNATLTTAAEFPVALSSGQNVNDINFGYSIANPGTLQFSNPTFSVRENEPTATVTVIRTGGSDGVVSADLNLSNGTATQDIDYGNPVPQTIFFADEETEQTINIPIVNDDLVENTETVNLSLSNVTGGATVGQPATLQIIDDDELLPPPQPFITRVLGFDNEFNNFDFVRSVPVTSTQGPPNLLFSRNTVALVSTNQGGHGRFDGTPSNNTVIAYDIPDPDRQLGFELDAIVIDLAEVIGQIGEIESGNLSLDYASPNRSHNVRFFNENRQDIGQGATLSPTIPVPGQPNNFSNFSRQSISIPGDTRFISIGSESTEIGIDNLQFTLQPEI